MIASIGGYILWDNFLNVTKLDLTSNIKLTYSGRSGEASISNIDNKIKLVLCKRYQNSCIKEVLS